MPDVSAPLISQHLMRYDGQIVFQGYPGSHSRQDLFPISCGPGHSQLNDCLLPICSIIPAIIALGVLVIWASKPLLHLRPRWMKPFVTELDEQTVDLVKDNKRYYTRSTVALLTVIPLCLLLQLVAALYPAFTVRASIPILPWVLIPVIEKRSPLTEMLGHSYTSHDNRTPEYCFVWSFNNCQQHLRHERCPSDRRALECSYLRYSILTHGGTILYNHSHCSLHAF